MRSLDGLHSLALFVAIHEGSLNELMTQDRYHNAAHGGSTDCWPRFDSRHWCSAMGKVEMQKTSGGQDESMAQVKTVAETAQRHDWLRC